MSLKKEVGILGGTFDPVHFGHLNLALCLMEFCSLAEVIFVPTSLSPFKEKAPPVVSVNHRLAMLKIAIEPIQNFRILDWEINQAGPTYTIDTVRRLAKESPFLNLHLLIGEDHLSFFHRWKDVTELIRLASPLVGTRDIKTVDPQIFLQSELETKLLQGRVKIPLFDISSTNVRERLAKKKYCGHLIPAAVLNYIQHHQLYS